MGLHTLFASNVEYKHKNTFCSKATLFIVITSAATILFPFIVAYRSRGFWIKHDVYYEQPNIQMDYNYLFVAVTEKSDSPIICSSYAEHDNTVTPYDKCLHMQVEEFDVNEDGVIDEIIFQMDVKTDDLSIKSFTMFLPLIYTLKTVCAFHMQSLAVIQKEFGFETYKFRIVTDVKLEQRNALLCKSVYLDNELNYSAIIEESNEQEIDVFHILKHYSQRRAYTSLQNQHSVSNPGRASIFSLEIILRYPEDAIRYKPGFWQVIKWAWIQYLPLYLLILWFMNKLKAYVFRNNLLFNFKIVPWAKDNNFYY